LAARRRSTGIIADYVSAVLALQDRFRSVINWEESNPTI